MGKPVRQKSLATELPIAFEEIIAELKQSNNRIEDILRKSEIKPGVGFRFAILMATVATCIWTKPNLSDTRWFPIVFDWVLQATSGEMCKILLFSTFIIFRLLQVRGLIIAVRDISDFNQGRDFIIDNAITSIRHNLQRERSLQIKKLKEEQLLEITRLQREGALKIEKLIEEKQLKQEMLTQEFKIETEQLRKHHDALKRQHEDVLDRLSRNDSNFNRLQIKFKQEQAKSNNLLAANRVCHSRITSMENEKHLQHNQIAAYKLDNENLRRENKILRTEMEKLEQEISNSEFSFSSPETVKAKEQHFETQRKVRHYKNVASCQSALQIFIKLQCESSSNQLHAYVWI